MNAPIKLSLAIALVLGGTNVWALGLGAIQVKSGLNQPLIAEIPVTISSPNEAAELQIAMASDEDFQRIGLSRARVGAVLQFAVVTRAHGEIVIQITSTENVREPYLDFLLQANWAKGKLLREYTVLLDPPVTSPTAKSAIAAETLPPSALVAKTPDTAPAPRSELPPAKSRHPSSAARVAVAKELAAPADVAANGKEYGPVSSGSALSRVARAVRGNSSVNLNQLMLALYKANPQAFFRSNINALKTGAVLRIPSADEIQAVGSLREAAAQVNRQTRDWASGVQPTMVAGSKIEISNKLNRPLAQADWADKKGTRERLALVPPRVGKDDQGKSDQPGAAGFGKTDANASGAELARTQESLVAREHEAAELKSRLKDLEDIKSKNDRLISLKDSEIAELQRKLKETQETAAKAGVPGTKPVAMPTISPATAPVLSDAEKLKASAAPSLPLQPATPEPSPSTTSVSTPAPAPVVAVPPAKSRPIVPKTVVPTMEVPWYKNILAWSGAGAILFVLGLFALLRSRKPVTLMRPTRDTTALADALDEHATQQEEERALLEELACHPDDIDCHLELLSLYYARRDVAKFESAAQAMHAQITESTQLEWQQAKAMGAELAPTYPLFADNDYPAHYLSDSIDTARDHGHNDHEPSGDYVSPTAWAGQSSNDAVIQPHHLGTDEIDLPLHPALAPPAAPGVVDMDESKHTPVRSFVAKPFALEETIVTKLDLARAYLDMGDSDGARGMIEEVIAEGNEAQQQEARKLLEEIR